MYVQGAIFLKSNKYALKTNKTGKRRKTLDKLKILAAQNRILTY